MRCKVEYQQALFSGLCHCTVLCRPTCILLGVDLIIYYFDRTLHERLAPSVLYFGSNYSTLRLGLFYRKLGSISTGTFLLELCAIVMPIMWDAYINGVNCLTNLHLQTDLLTSAVSLRHLR